MYLKKLTQLFSWLHAEVTAVHTRSPPAPIAAPPSACSVHTLLRVRQVQAAFTAGAILIFGGWVDAKKTVGYVDWSLLLLIGSALGLSKGIVNSGLANFIGGAIRDSGISADASLFVLYAFTMVSREIVRPSVGAQQQ